MTQKEILKQIKRYDWWSEESPCTHQTAEWAWRGFLESSKHFHPRLLSIGIFIYRNNFAYEETRRDEKLKQFYFALDKIKKDPLYLTKERCQWKRTAQAMLKIGWELIGQIEKLPTKQLAEKYKMFTELAREQARYSVFAECVDPFTDDELPKLLQKELPSISMSERANIAAVMSAPTFLSFMEKERIYFLKSCKKIIAQESDINQEAKKLEKRYIWMATHYGKSAAKTSARFKKEIIATIKKSNLTDIEKELKQLHNKTKRIKRQKQQLVKKYKISKELRIIFRLINEFGVMIDQRKEAVMQMTFILFRILENSEKRLGIPSQLLSYAGYEELYRWLKDGVVVSAKELKERQKFSVFWVEFAGRGKSKAKFIFGKDAREIYNAFFPKRAVKQIKGIVASKAAGKVKGRVSLVLNTSKDKFKTGDILLTTMTRPDFLPLMRKAKAIITDEGGLTCHAAIISRELKLPCIIGARIATKILRNGQLVEMDTEKGIIKILK